jgi:toxin CcdB
VARFDVYLNPDGQGALLDVQADLLSQLNTRVVVPLLPANYAPKPARHLNPCFQVQNETLVMVTQFMAAVPLNVLRHRIGDLQPERDTIVAAIDFLMQGY